MSRPTAQPEQLLGLAQGGDGEALGQLLELYGNYLMLLARMQIGRRLQGKVDAADLVQETFLAAHRDFVHFRGKTEPELVSWLRQILAANVIDLVRRYCGTRRRDVRLERQLAEELDQSSRAMGLVLVAKNSSPSQQALRREQAVLLADALNKPRRETSPEIELAGKEKNDPKTAGGARNARGATQCEAQRRVPLTACLPRTA